MQEDMVCAGDIIVEIENAELLETDAGDEIKTFSAECGKFTFIVC